MRGVQPIVLAGGSGSRLWPVSRETYPKQLLNLIGNRSLLQNTVIRTVGIPDSYPPLIVVGEEHRYITRSQIGELGIVEDCSILLEPLGRSTGPAICGAVEYARQQRGDECVVLILPSDHLIGKVDNFYRAVEEAVQLALDGYLVTFGIDPQRPETGYGYIEEGEGSRVLSFKEKPGYEEAKQYLAAGNYYWNSGMFAFTPAVFNKEMRQHAPDMHACMTTAINNGSSKGGFFRYDAESMCDVEDSSIDYILMEKTTAAAVVHADLDWADIGSWQALWQVLEGDKDGNVCRGDVLLENTKNSLIMADGRLVAAIGLEDMVVVETADAVMVSAISAVQGVKNIVQLLKNSDRHEFHLHNTVHRPWGWYTTLESQERYKIKRIRVNPSSGLSLQKHYHRYEHWIVVSGTAKITNGDEVFLLYENQSSYIPAGVIHRLENPGTIPLEIIEIQIGSYLGEDDIIRYDDEYA